MPCISRSKRRNKSLCITLLPFFFIHPLSTQLNIEVFRDWIKFVVSDRTSKCMTPNTVVIDNKLINTKNYSCAIAFKSKLPFSFAISRARIIATISATLLVILSSLFSVSQILFLKIRSDSIFFK